MENAGGGGAAPTGCYKCGRPGHWSRDCPSNPNGSNPNVSNKSTGYPSFKNKSAGGSGADSSKRAEKPKKVPRSIPKLTPEMLLSDDGLGYILRHFPRAFKYRGRGHEVSDLGNLLGLYAEWHQHLLPYYSFNQFVHKVEQVGASKRVRLCIRELQGRVANGGDLTKLHEHHDQQGPSNNDQDTMNAEGASLHQEDTAFDKDDTNDLQENLLDEIYKSTTEGPSHSPHRESVTADTSLSGNNSIVIEISQEQKARMEANRLRALEKATAHSRLLHST